MKIALLGGGLDMNRLSQKLKKQSHHVHCFLTLRHSQEDFNGITLMESLIESQVNYEYWNIKHIHFVWLPFPPFLIPSK